VLARGPAAPRGADAIVEFLGAGRGAGRNS
jgi:hypothetical protein